MKLAMRIAAVDHVHAFGSAVIPLLRFRSHRLAAQGNLVSLDDLTRFQQFQRALFLVHDDLVSAGESVQRRKYSKCSPKADYLPEALFVSQEEHG
jgi:hypothetical protein